VGLVGQKGGLREAGEKGDGTDQAGRETVRGRSRRSAGVAKLSRVIQIDEENLQMPLGEGVRSTVGRR
jgi:hypothetical protein